MKKTKGGIRAGRLRVSIPFLKQSLGIESINADIVAAVLDCETDTILVGLVGDDERLPFVHFVHEAILPPEISVTMHKDEQGTVTIEKIEEVKT